QLPRRVRQGPPLPQRRRPGLRPQGPAAGDAAVEPDGPRLAARDRPPRRQAVHRLPGHAGPAGDALGGRGLRAPLPPGAREGRDSAGRGDREAPARAGAVRPAGGAAAAGAAMRVVMMGTGAFAEPTFEALLSNPGLVVGLFTSPDREMGAERGSTRQT